MQATVGDITVVAKGIADLNKLSPEDREKFKTEGLRISMDDGKAVRYVPCTQGPALFSMVIVFNSLLSIQNGAKQMMIFNF